MAEPWSIRLNDKKAPERSEQFFEAVGQRLVDPVEVVKRLVDAWMAYQTEHGHPPKFPVAIVPEEEFSVLREQADAYRARKTSGK